MTKHIRIDDNDTDGNECIYCAVHSYSIASRGSTKIQVLSKISASKLMTCLNCHSKFCIRCVREMINFIEKSNIIPAKVKSYDVSYIKLKQVHRWFIYGSKTISLGPCCSFIQQPFVAASSIRKTPRPYPLTRSSRKDSIKKFRSSINKIKTDNLNVPESECIPLEQYFDNPKLTSHEELFKPKECPGIQHKRILLKRKKRNQHVNINSKYNPFSGALVIPTFGLIIQGEVTNSHWYCDHHGLARSNVDGTFDVPHCVLSHDTASRLHESKFPISRIFGSREVICLYITSPEDCSKTRSIKIEVIDVNQQLATTFIQPMKGDNNLLDIDFTTMSLFGSEDIRPDVDVTIILGHFTIDTNIHPKLLLLRFSGMLANSKYSLQRKQAIASELYFQLRSISGRQGYEVTRRGGSSGKVTNQSDRDLIDCIHDVPGMCPRKLLGVIILRGPFSYYLVYTNVSSSAFVCYQYPPPKEGGSFRLPPTFLYSHPVLAKFAYLKMIAIEILRSLNTHRVSHGLSLLAQGIIECESRKMNEAREFYRTNKLSGKQRTLYSFVECFSSLHTYSMVCHPVGIHADHFRDGDESLENKILFSTSCLNQGSIKRLGRGGCIMGTQYVYALLDW